MADNTNIEWADASWSPVTGCTPISEGCQNCYAKRMAQRLRGRFGYPKDDPFKVTFHPDRLEQPLKWKKPRKVFVCSMGDLFHDDVPAYTYTGNQVTANHIFATAHKCPQHTFLILTKRPKNMKSFCMWWHNGQKGHITPNIWLGVTAENQKQLNRRWPILAQTRAAKKFISGEPLLEPIDFHLGDLQSDVIWRRAFGASTYGNRILPDWGIIGCESGPKRRFAKLSWFRNVRDQFKGAGIPLFIKQIEINGKVSHDMSEWPEDLRIRQYPE